ncbi:MAG: DMT family transporter [Pseudomonadales bacterium]
MIAVVSMSAVPVLVKSTAANEVTIGIARLAIAALLMTPLVFVRGSIKKLSVPQLTSMTAIGAVFALHWLTYFLSIKLSTASIGAMAISTFGVQYLLLARIFNNERTGRLEWLAVACCLLGCMFAVDEFTFSSSNTLGMLVGILSGTLYACMPLLHQRATGIDTVTRAWGQFTFALCFMLPLVSFSNWQLSTADYSKLLVLGVLCTVIAHGLWVKASTELPAIVTSLVYYLYVPLAMLSSAWFLDETMTTGKMLGAALILGSSVVVTLYRFRSASTQSD